MGKRKDFWFTWLGIWIGVIVFILFGEGLVYLACSNTELLFTKIAIQVFLIATAIISTVFHFVDYLTINKMDDKSVKMKFDNFKDTYHVNPNRWYIQDGRLKYKYEEGWYITCYYVTFSYFDWLKFILWKVNKEHYERIEHRRKKERECDERMIKMLKCVQKDINRAYEKIASIETK